MERKLEKKQQSLAFGNFDGEQNMAAPSQPEQDGGHRLTAMALKMRNEQALAPASIVTIDAGIETPKSFTTKSSQTYQPTPRTFGQKAQRAARSTLKLGELIVKKRIIDVIRRKSVHQWKSLQAFRKRRRTSRRSKTLDWFEERARAARKAEIR